MRKLLLFVLIWQLTTQVAAADWPSSEDEEVDPALVRLICKSVPGPEVATFGVAIKHLPTGRAAYWNADRSVEAASLLKLPALYEAYRQRSMGLLSFAEQLVITEQHVELAFGSSPVEVGESLTVEQALELMITLSDNASAVALLDRLGYYNVNRSTSELGLEHTVVATDSTTSARDMLRFFETLARLEAVDAEASQEMIARLLRQRVNDRIPAWLPPGTPVAHKTGNLPGVYHDAGIVYTPDGPLVLVMLTDGATDYALVRDSMAGLAAQVYEYVVSEGFADADEEE
ncbi:MAG: serine hydrolase [Chloroflexi bacterium]|nr:serine hydrolase [Chloroflexota bacterium]